MNPTNTAYLRRQLENSWIENGRDVFVSDFLAALDALDRVWALCPEQHPESHDDWYDGYYEAKAQIRAAIMQGEDSDG